jgi:hypothetical protein
MYLSVQRKKEMKVVSIEDSIASSITNANQVLIRSNKNTEILMLLKKGRVAIDDRKNGKSCTVECVGKFIRYGEEHIVLLTDKFIGLQELFPLVVDEEGKVHISRSQIGGYLDRTSTATIEERVHQFNKPCTFTVSHPELDDQYVTVDDIGNGKITEIIYFS